jgi:hypothetical protein
VEECFEWGLAWGEKRGFLNGGDFRSSREHAVADKQINASRRVMKFLCSAQAREPPSQSVSKRTAIYIVVT